MIARDRMHNISLHLSPPKEKKQKKKTCTKYNKFEPMGGTTKERKNVIGVHSLPSNVVAYAFVEICATFAWGQ